MQHPESLEQQKVIQWLRVNYPYVLFTASVQENGKPQQAIRRKLMGYQAGTPDIAIYEQRGIYGGLFVEMKACKGGVVSEAQENFLLALNHRGYLTTVAHGFDEARKEIISYLNGHLRKTT